MAKYLLSNSSVEDLDSIWNYTYETWSEQQADLYYANLISTFEAIANSPCKLDKYYPEIKVGLYARKCGKHLVFYKQINKDQVLILRILHERMDIRSKF